MKNNWKILIAWIATVLVVFITLNSVNRDREAGRDVYNAKAMEDTIRLYKDRYNRRWRRSYPCYRFPARC